MPNANCKVCGKYHQWPEFLNIEIKCCGYILLPKKEPKWVHVIRILRKSEDKGIGDTIQRMLAMFGGERFKAFAKKRGIPCGCTRRQEELNELYPY